MPHTDPASSAASTVTAGEDERGRDSNLIRASVLDAALQLGLGANGNVAHWLFNPVSADDGDDQEVSACSHPPPVSMNRVADV